MSKHNHNAHEATQETPEVNEQETTGAESAEIMDNMEAEAGADETEALKDQLDKLQQELDKEKKEYLFLMAEFDNFRKRTLKEKAELIRNGAESAMKSLLPVVDDFERGIDAIKATSDADAVKEGMILIYNKFVKYLEQNGVKAMDTNGQPYDADLHEAVAMVPGDEANKGLIIDTIQKGYLINDKVLRHAKVAVGQ
ncbi:MAG: nucleotide exchange factor GrpE [Muribaculaceae bacterium]|nr:nucleotide exchange factor GrpE [Muribaculaceae bacterium]MDE5971132.1 nucleotide exchange factor GrpE [Muribaculaceae bacterium]MDE6462475.1 nucleotide exchange factor GrpE [Muribaculaceae bacterium]MDE6509856.1 nucleotide exchange factor GrpE [Muribaculaceae bacterium]MDE7143690.1 nucleotide exchange factor GrpE [Muribaculaceae bacterium]